ncbi:MAG TPA: hypothetical protein ENN43_03745, partial [bacterium]|nr:hypothetical protein [bacterium]
MAVLFICLNAELLNAGNIWIDGRGTSSTSGTWDSGIRSDTETSIYPPYVKRWEKYEWRGEGGNVVPASGNYPLIYNGYVYFGEGNNSNTEPEKWYEPGYVWAWDIATGVTKTGYPLGPLDSGIISGGGGVVIGNDKLYALTLQKLWGWDISGEEPQLLTGFPVDVTETAGTDRTYLMNGLVYWGNKIYFCSQWKEGNTTNVKSYIYVKNGITGEEEWRREIATVGGGQTPAIWNGRVYVAGRGDGKIYCWDAETGDECANFPVDVIGNMRAMPIIQEGKIYIGTHAGYFYRIDAV